MAASAGIRESTRRTRGVILEGRERRRRRGPRRRLALLRGVVPDLRRGARGLRRRQAACGSEGRAKVNSGTELLKSIPIDPTNRDRSNVGRKNLCTLTRNLQ